jgi:transcriptional pleiotropic regulator of transition state genes
MAKGIVRRLDELGRITVPKEFRTTAGIQPGERVGIELEGTVLHIVRVDKDYIGMDRPVDDLGRITLPIEARRSINCSERERLDIYVENSEIYIKKAGCHFCSGTSNLKEFKKTHICGDCIQGISRLA